MVSYSLPWSSSPVVWLIPLILDVSPATAQIIPDNTLGSESSILVPEQIVKGQPADLIQGGALRGANLFHSFLEFNVRDGQRVYFQNPEAIDRILMRVTGSAGSTLAGTLGVLGNADLFVLNPNGLFFGPNARLDLNGSFVGSTAASVRFEGFAFSTLAPSAPPLLNIQVPLGLQYGQNTGAIEVIGRGNHVRGTSLSLTTINPQGGLVVNAGQTLALLGGSMDLDGAALQAVEGQIILMAGAGSGEITLGEDSQGWRFSSPVIPQPIAITGGSLISGARGVKVEGSDLTLTGRSYLVNQVADTPYLGTLSLNVRDRLDLAGASAILTEATATAPGESLQIQARTIHLTEDSRISSITGGSGRAGAITLTPTDRLDLKGYSSQPGVGTQIRSSTLGAGEAGNITITTPLITLSNGAVVTTSAISPSTGNAGAIHIRASEVQVNGVEPISLLPSAIRSVALSSGNAGVVDIQSDRVWVTGGGRITAVTANRGNAGEVQITASDFITVEGYAANQSPSLISAAANPLGSITQTAFGLPDVPTGNSGALTLRAPNIVVQNGGLITTNNEGTGNAGTLSIVSDRLWVRNGGQISSTVLRGTGGKIAIDTDTLTLNDSSINTSVLEAGAGGNISVTAKQVLLDNSQLSTNTAGTDSGGNVNLTATQWLGLRHGSTIAANATGTEAGGNIQIQTPVLFALENSDITANAANNRGGTQIIRAQTILGTTVRPTLTNGSDITASSALGADLQGTVTLSTPNLDVSSGLLHLNPSPVDPSQQLSTGCKANQDHYFALVGRGGLPDNPIQVARNPPLLVDHRFDLRLSELRTSATHPTISLLPPPQASSTLSEDLPPPPIQEAVRWFRDAHHQIHLVGMIGVNAPALLFFHPMDGHCSILQPSTQNRPG